MSSTSESLRFRALAFYLPQFHPILENNLWWGNGFTEWTNTVRAKPLFWGHKQPHFPADLGFYDLRVPEVREQQADLARTHGIAAFCYWHYWFGNGKRLLERPLDEVVKCGSPDFPFCLAWANTSWRGTWYGAGNQVLVEQKYPGKSDYEQHFYAVLKYFEDPRYLRVGNRPVFLIMVPNAFPDLPLFLDLWQELAARHGLGSLYFIGFGNTGWIPEAYGFDASLVHGCTPQVLVRNIASPRMSRWWNNHLGRRLFRTPRVYDYADVVRAAISSDRRVSERCMPTVYPNWDNTPRAGSDGIVFANSSPLHFRKYLEKAAAFVQDYPPEERFVFIKSWNEWAEGNYLEPDMEHGMAFLEQVRDVAFGRGS